MSRTPERRRVDECHCSRSGLPLCGAPSPCICCTRARACTYAEACRIFCKIMTLLTKNRTTAMATAVATRLFFFRFCDANFCVPRVRSRGGHSHAGMSLVVVKLWYIKCWHGGVFGNHQFIESLFTCVSERRCCPASA